MKKVLVVEPNKFHNEVLPGVVKYFNELGYFVDVYIREEVKNENVFCRYEGDKALFALSIEEILFNLSSEKMQQYEFVFFSSMEYLLEGKIVRFLDIVGMMPSSRYGVLGIYHTSSDVEKFSDYKLAEEGRLFCLSDFQVQKYKLKVLNPHYFGTYVNSDFSGNRKRTFAVIGSAAETEELSKVLNHIDPQIRKRIEIIWIGGKKRRWRSLYLVIRKVIIYLLGFFCDQYLGKRNIKALGHITFSKLYKTIEKVDFIIVMINDVDEHLHHYLTVSTSGIKQMILGFQKPFLIQSEIAEVYGFKNVGIHYERGGVEEAFYRALCMSKEEYKLECLDIEKLEKEIFMHSLEQLKDTIENIISEMGE